MSKKETRIGAALEGKRGASPEDRTAVGNRGGRNGHGGRSDHRGPTGTRGRSNRPHAKTKHHELQQELFVIRKGFWSNEDALMQFDAVVADIKAMAEVPTRGAEYEEVKYQWCVVDGGPGFWCVCKTVISGGTPKIQCTEV